MAYAPINNGESGISARTKINELGTRLDGIEYGGNIVVKSGTELIPSISFIGNMDTGIFSPGDSIIGFTVGGTEGLRLSESLGLISLNTSGSINALGDIQTAGNLYALGSVGIGLEYPRKKVDILSTTESQLRLSYQDNIVFSDFTLDSAGLLTISPTGNFSLYQNYGNVITSVFSNAVANSLYISGGRIGIGTTAPKTKLDILSNNIGQLRLSYEDDIYFSDLSVNSNGTLEIHATGNIVLNPAGNNILPDTSYELNIGSLQNKFLTLHAAELWVETLVAQETMATIGGRILVGGTTTLVFDIPADYPIITLKHNQMVTGDIVYMEANGQVEFISIDSEADGLDGNYSYTVTRNLDGSGSNDWSAGDAVFNTGAAGNGFIDLYSYHSSKSATQYGATIVGNIRNSPIYNDWTEAWAIGNLNGLYGYGSDTFGVGLGKYGEANYLTIDPTEGMRFYDATGIQRASLSGDTWVLGYTSEYHTEITPTSFKINLGALTLTELSSGSLILGDASGYHTEVNAIAFKIKQNTTTYTELTSGSLILGDASNEHVLIDTSGITIKDGTTVNANYSSTITIGQVGVGLNNIYIDSGNLHLRNNTDDVILLSSSGNEFKNVISMLDVGAGLAFGETGTIPTSSSTGSGIWIDKTGFYSLEGGVAEIKITKDGLFSGFDVTDLIFTSKMDSTGFWMTGVAGKQYGGSTLKWVSSITDPSSTLYAMVDLELYDGEPKLNIRANGTAYGTVYIRGGKGLTDGTDSTDLSLGTGGLFARAWYPGAEAYNYIISGGSSHGGEMIFGFESLSTVYNLELIKISGKTTIGEIDLNGVTRIGNVTHTSNNQYDVNLFGNGSLAQSGNYYSKLRIFGGGSQSRALELWQEYNAYAHIGSGNWSANKLYIDSNFIEFNVGSALANFSGNATISGDATILGDKYQKHLTSSSMAAGWVRFADCAIGVGSSKQGSIFEIRWTKSGQHGYVRFAVGHYYGNLPGSSVMVLNSASYGIPAIANIRLLTNVTYSTNSAYIEFYNSSASTVFDVYMLSGFGWRLITPVVGSVPAGYTTHQVAADGLFAVGNYYGGLSVNRDGTTYVNDGTNYHKLDGVNAVTFNFGDGNNAVVAGASQVTNIPFNCNAYEWDMQTDGGWQDMYIDTIASGNYPSGTWTTVAYCNSGGNAISSGTININLTAGYILRGRISSVPGVTKTMSVTLRVRKT